MQAPHGDRQVGQEDNDDPHGGQNSEVAFGEGHRAARSFDRLATESDDEANEVVHNVQDSGNDYVEQCKPPEL